ncbi:hypothetical protein FIBSPDRAFT_865478 [Athelia psychrophila]|uniref:Uncharacterized protein n=1 Tax=Athelia psychrophila TaxID=1759441 RepID=A0A166FLD0_9AGAM|nr:hypothetical protein FIBSPDRAFT_865478 [Fibularhizoctonia sp. CBS 109695]
MTRGSRSLRFLLLTVYPDVMSTKNVSSHSHCRIALDRGRLTSRRIRFLLSPSRLYIFKFHESDEIPQLNHSSSPEATVSEIDSIRREAITNCSP